jgi:hypothetical protein
MTAASRPQSYTTSRDTTAVTAAYISQLESEPPALSSIAATKKEDRNAVRSSERVGHAHDVGNQVVADTESSMGHWV